MSPTRRDVLKIAAALPTVGAAMSRRDAFAEMMKPIGLEPVRFEDHPDEPFDPASFADAIYRGTLQNVLGRAEIEPGAQAMHEYKACRLALLVAHPELTSGKLGDLFVKLDEAVWAVWGGGHWEGVRAGAAMENLRLAVIGPMQGQADGAFRRLPILGGRLGWNDQFPQTGTADLVVAHRPSMLLPGVTDAGSSAH